MIDFMFKAKSQEAWEAFARLLPEDAQLDTIGSIDESTEYHVNVRFIEKIDPVALLLSLGPDVEWVDPATVKTPTREWSGGMFYWSP